MKKLFLSMTVLLLMSFSHAENNFLNLDGEWLFRYVSNSRSADSLCASGFYGSDYDPGSFYRIKVPSCWALLGFEGPVYGGSFGASKGEGFYIRHFRIPESYSGKRILLHFGGVWASAEIWLNGKWLGRHDSGYTSFSYDVTGKLNVSGKNVLAVRVRQVYPGFHCDIYDDWTLGGIYRNVSLETMPAERWIDEVRAVTDFDDCYKDADLELKVVVADRMKRTRHVNYTSPGEPYSLRFTLSDREGKTVVQELMEKEGHPQNHQEISKTLKVKAPKQWNAEHPYLYTLQVDLLEHGTVTHSNIQKIGFREISVSGGVFRINGQPVKLRGVNHHDEHPDVGRATTHEHWLKDLTLMKAAHINYIRTAHYQHSKGFIELCDSIGMYVGSEVSLGGAEALMYNPGFVSGVMLRTYETVKRDLNNPSVVYWSVGNEDPFTSLFLDAVKVVKALDGTRPVLLPWNADERLPDEIDILAPHYWTADEYDSLTRRSLRPVISTEYTHAYGEKRFGGLEERWNAFLRNPAGAGAAIWMWADQGISMSSDKDDKHLHITSKGWDGIVDSYRNITEDYREVKAVYAPVKLAEKSQPIPLGAEKVMLKVRNDYDFTSLDGVLIDWELYKDGIRLDQGIASAAADPHSLGEFEVPLKKLKRVAGGETVYVNVRFTDAEGRDITQNTVELVPDYEKIQKAGKGTGVDIIDEGNLLYIKAGGLVCVFSRNTGSVCDVKKKSCTLLKNLMPSVWHELDDGDKIIRNRNFAEDAGPDCLKADVRLFEYCRKGENVVVYSEVNYRSDEKNGLQARFNFTVKPCGKIEVEYVYDTDFQTDFLPLVGLSAEMTSASGLENWFGWGPRDSYPNKNAAAVLGLWSGENAFGTKTVRWVEVDDGKESIRVYSDGYLLRDASVPDKLHFAPYVLGRSEKTRLKNYFVRAKGMYKGRVVIE